MRGNRTTKYTDAFDWEHTEFERDDLFPPEMTAPDHATFVNKWVFKDVRYRRYSECPPDRDHCSCLQPSPLRCSGWDPRHPTRLTIESTA
jgi:hypothetical protein